MTQRGAGGAATDGRLLRSERSRQRIADALYELIGEGDLEPSAQRVADRAGVGIRTVFRLFSDMDALYATIDERVGAYLRATLRHRGRSAFLSAQYRRLLLGLREQLQRWLPELRDAPEALVEALDQATSFEAWDRLRRDQRLSRARAQAAMDCAMESLLRTLEERA